MVEKAKESLSTLWSCWRLQATKWFQVLQLGVSFIASYSFKSLENPGFLPFLFQEKKNFFWWILHKSLWAVSFLFCLKKIKTFNYLSQQTVWRKMVPSKYRLNSVIKDPVSSCLSPPLFSTGWPLFICLFVFFLVLLIAVVTSFFTGNFNVT